MGNWFIYSHRKLTLSSSFKSNCLLQRRQVLNKKQTKTTNKQKTWHQIPTSEGVAISGGHILYTSMTLLNSKTQGVRPGSLNAIKLLLSQKIQSTLVISDKMQAPKQGLNDQWL